MLSLVLRTDPVPPVQEVPQPHVLLPRVLQASILLLILGVLNVLRLVLQLNMNQQLVLIVLLMLPLLRVRHHLEVL